MRQDMNSMKKGFTLVELLVVMTVIAILMGLLLPAIIQARTSALLAKCVNNERQLATAIIAYDQSKQRLPYYVSNNNGTWCTSILEPLGFGKLASEYAENQAGFQASPQPMFRCPAGDAEQIGLNYVVNCGLSGDTTTDAARASGLFFSAASKIKKSLSEILDGASQTILLSENLKANGASSNWTQGNENSLGITWVNSDYDTPAKYPKPFPSSSHGNNTNVAFADGHVQSVSKAIRYNTYKCLMAPDDTAAGLTWENDPNFEQQ